MAPKTAAPRTERGYVNPLAGYGSFVAQGLDQFEQVDELRWPNSVYTYTRMCREEARIASVLRAIGLPIRRTDWRIRPNGAQPEVVEHVAACLGLPVEGEDADQPTPRTRGRFSWDQHLRLALKSLQFGHAVFEQTYFYEGGRFWLKRLAPRPQSSIAYWNVDRDGGLISVQQWPAGTFGGPGMVVMAPNSMGPAIPVDRLVVYTHDMDPGVWTGNSLLRPAYKNWKLKDELIRIEAAAIRRHGIGVPYLKGNESDSEDDERMDELLAIASNYSGGESAGLALTAGEEAGILSPNGTPLDPRRAIEYHDHQMALVALAHFLNLDGKGGSYALASVQADTFVQSVQTVADEIRDVAQAHVVEDIVDVNWGEDEPAPLLVFDEIGSRQDATAAALQMLVNAGLLTPDPRLEAFLRDAAGLPGRGPDADDEGDDENTAETGQDEPEADEPALPNTSGASSTTNAPQARKRPRGRSPRDRRKTPDGAIPLWD
ncbi:portal protein [Mycobacterium phage Jebeks]|uniref:Portal protein n=1 Tax=Mycobacterium phage Jebeks TaxID=1076631 RepID=A0A2L1ISR5_9CAUD|nr:portal protein [Mycobacterium phage Jebeks]AVD98041.1 portal protein [Mycobacterium phage Jebeks]